MLKMTKRVRAVISIALLLVFVLLSCACQATPKKAVVVYGGGLEEKLQGTPAPEGAYDAPKSWRETLDMKGGKAKIEIDAAVTVPNVTAFPVYKVKKSVFDNASIDSMVKYFTKGRDVYKVTEPTKAELEEAVVYAKKDNDKETAEEFENKLAAAPETVEKTVITDWNVNKSTSGRFLDEGGEYSDVDVEPDVFSYGKGFIETEKMALLNDKGKIGDVSITEEDAIAAAQNMLHVLGTENMAVSSIEKAQRYACLSLSSLAQYSEETVSKGYMIRFARNIDGIPGIVDNGTTVSYMDKFDYAAPLYPEEIQVYVDENGEVQSFCWWSPLKTEETVTKNAALMPFSDMKQRIRDMLTYINSYDSLPITVTGIRMNMALINVKDSSEEAMYVPSWFIDYTETDKQGGAIQYTLVLNAIDGGRVLEIPVDSDMQQVMDNANK